MAIRNTDRPGDGLLLAGLIIAPLLIIWNTASVVTLLNRDEFSGRGAASAAAKLTPIAAEISDLLTQPESGLKADNEDARRAAFASRVRRICDVSKQAVPMLARVGRAAPAEIDNIRRASEAITRACLVGSGGASSENLSRPQAIRAAFEGYLTQSLAGIESAGVDLLELDRAALLREQRWRLLDAIAGLMIGLLCLALLRRRGPESEPAQETSFAPYGAIVAGSSPEGGSLGKPGGPGLFFFCDVFDSAPVALVLLAGDGRITRLNYAAQRLTGYSNAEVRRSFYWDVFLEGTESIRAAVDFPVPEERGPITETWVSRGSERKKILWSRALIRDQAGQVTQVLMAAASPAKSVLFAPVR